MQLDIISSVGDTMPDGSPSFNNFDDVLVIQYLLNQSGVLDEPLPLDGEATPALIKAIIEFENFEPTVLEIDGRIDPLDAAWVALNNTPLPEFEGVQDRQEWRMIIQRPFPEWNFTRGRFKTLADVGFDLSFEPEQSAWMPDTLKNTLLLMLTELLDPAVPLAPTFGVHPSDWHHVHLGLWSGQKDVSVGLAARIWKVVALEILVKIQQLRSIHLHDLPGFTVGLTQLINSPEVQTLLNQYVKLPEAVMVAHTFEFEHWRPFMLHTDPRRQWMANSAGDILKPPYTDHAEMAAADATGEFICENSLQICFLIDEFAVIHPLLGIPRDLKIYTGFELDFPNAPEGPALHP